MSVKPEAESSFLSQVGVHELCEGMKVNSPPRGTGYVKEFLFFFFWLNAVGYYAKLLLEEPPNKINQLLPSNGISLKSTTVRSLHGLRPSERRLTISKTAGREGSLGCSILN